MALTQGARNKIISFVQSAKPLLMKEFADQIQQYYGIRLDGSYLMVEELSTKDGSVIQTARLLRERLDYLEDTIAGSNKKEEAVEQLVREQAFTILNRFAALRMAEERQIIPETIKQSYNSEGFQVFDQLSGGAQTAEQFERYNWFLKAMFDELAIDLPAVFDRFSPYALLFPSEKVMLELLDIINDEDLSIYREEGQQPMNLWEEDETIGWIYQYYNSRKEVKTMRDASDIPRNSRELAVRNQFFTPRYVVQFLVDNSLGRQWFEMTKGQTSLVNDCQYMVKREQEIFLDKGEVIPEAKIEGANYIEYRALKDPREILMLDPACGSMHFGLYCFDLFEQIYTEAWDNHPELMPDLRDKYLREDYIKRIPGYILQYNIHGVDIDQRAIQIAGLSLWLRAQKSYKKLGLQPADRPMIKKSNLVVAEPMPGDADLLSEFTRSLPGPIGKLVRVIWDKMQLAGETGLLLKIEEELKNEIEIAKQEYETYKDSSAQTALFDAPAESKAAEMAAIYGKDQKITKDFFDTAEEEVLKALQSFSENAEGEHAFQKLLFAEDTARGFAFIELCRKNYDVIVMNPPFGSCTLNTKEYLNNAYPSSKQDIYAIFIDRSYNSLLLNNGQISAITNRNGFFLQKLEIWRKTILLDGLWLSADLGSEIMDNAAVSAMAYVINKIKRKSNSTFFRLNNSKNKSKELLDATGGNFLSKTFDINLESFAHIPFSPICYWGSISFLNIFKNFKTFSNKIGFVYQGIATGNNDRYLRLWWEIPAKSKIYYKGYFKGGGAYDYYNNSLLVVKWSNNGAEMKADAAAKYGSASRTIKNEDKFFQSGLTYTQVSSSGLMARPMTKDSIFDMKGPHVEGKIDLFALLAIMNSKPFNILTYFLTDNRQLHPTIVNKVPVPNLSSETIEELSKLAQNITNEICHVYKNSEVSFQRDLSYRSYTTSNVKKNRIKIDNIVASAYGVELDEFRAFDYLLTSNIDDRRYSELNVHDSELDIFSKNFAKFIGRKSPQINNCIDFDLSIPIEADSNCKAFYYFENNFFNNEYEVSIGEIDKSKMESYFSRTGIDSYFELLNTKFFTYHLALYTQDKRLAPLYWPIANRSNTFIIWIYYPALNENTLFKIVNELVEPKLEDLKKQVAALEMSSAFKELHEQMALRDELIDFKEELLRVAQLPYKPNQDDGVLITAAPLHNLFRHTKWRKSTEACWKKLEKGEYDWAHLAYSIWPDRVANKCKKDLSMAIAHGLESICEIKPKEKKSRKKPEIKVETQDKLL